MACCTYPPDLSRSMEEEHVGVVKETPVNDYGSQFINVSELTQSVYTSVLPEDTYLLNPHNENKHVGVD